MSEMTNITLEVPTAVLQDIKKIAEMDGTDPKTIARGYIEEGVKNDQTKTKLKHFTDHVKEVLEQHNVPADAIEEIYTKFLY